MVLQRSFHLEFTYLQPDQWHSVAHVILKIIKISNRYYNIPYSPDIHCCYMLHISVITASPVWIMPSSQRGWLHIGILHRVTARKNDGAYIQLRHHLPSKRQDYQFIKSHGGQCHIHHEQSPNAFTSFTSYFNVLHRMPCHMGIICPDFTSLIFVIIILQ